VNQMQEIGRIVNLAALKKSGAYYIGPCPFCGGEDRFNLKHTDQGWKWFCRVCGDGKYHSVVDFAIRQTGNLPQAVDWLKWLGLDVEGKNAAGFARQKPERIDYELWQDQADDLLSEWREEMQKESSKKVKEYLAKRGIDEAAILRYGLGYNRTDRYEPREKWGLADGNRLWIPRGIVLPYYDRSEAVIGVNIRRPILQGHKYHKIAGSRRGLFGWKNLAKGIHLFTEGEFDCMVAEAHLDDVVGVASWGSATQQEIDMDMLWEYADVLLAGQVAIYVMDNDEAGERALDKLKLLGERIIAVRSPRGYKDLTEYWQEGNDLWEWFKEMILETGIVLPTDE
jgi:DNA primase